MVTKQAVKLIVTHLLRCQDVIGRCGHIIEVEDFYSDDERTYRLIWACAKEWFLENGTTIPEEWLKAAVEKRVADDPEYLTRLELTDLIQLIRLIYAMPEDCLVPDAVVRLVQEFLTERRSMTKAQELLEADSNEFQTQLDELNRVHSNAQFSTAQEVRLFEPDTTYDLSAAARNPTGVNWFDLLLGGGITPGEIYGLVAPTGGGKTMAAIHLCCEIAKSGRRAAYMGYENELGPQIRRRIIGCACGISRGVLDSKDPPVARVPDDLPADARARYEDVMSRYQLHENLVLLDMARSGMTNAGPATIDATLKQFSDQGRHIDFLVIDQLQPMVDGWMAQVNASKDHRRQFMQQAIVSLGLTARPDHRNCSILVLHQVDNVWKTKRPTTVPTMGGASEDKSFENWVQFCLAFGTKDKNDIGYIATTKGREAPCQALIVHIDGYRNKVSYKPNKYVACENEFRCVDDQDTDHTIKSVNDYDMDRPRPQAPDTHGIDVGPI